MTDQQDTFLEYAEAQWIVDLQRDEQPESWVWLFRIVGMPI